jgi:hypothetical protein
MRFNKKLSVCLIDLECWLQVISILVVRKTIQKSEIDIADSKMLLVSHILQSSWQMGYGNNLPTDISELLHIGNVREAFQSSNQVNDI